MPIERTPNNMPSIKLVPSDPVAVAEASAELFNNLQQTFAGARRNEVNRNVFLGQETPPVPLGGYGKGIVKKVIQGTGANDETRISQREVEGVVVAEGKNGEKTLYKPKPDVHSPFGMLPSSEIGDTEYSVQSVVPKTPPKNITEGVESIKKSIGGKEEAQLPPTGDTSERRKEYN